MHFTVFHAWGPVPRGTGIAVRARLSFNRNEWDWRRRTMRFTCFATAAEVPRIAGNAAF